jgi:hypothetical protein
MYRHPPSPSHRPTQGKDETHLPKGECRYLLLHPDIRGQRCACVGFCLNKATPGSSCECGHGACYHIATKEDRLTDKEEIEALKQKVQRLEDMLEHERYGNRNSLTTRLSELEEMFDRYKTDMDSEVKTAYRGIGGLWHNVGALQRRSQYYDDRIDSLVDANQATRDDIRTLQKRVIEIDDSSMELEERLDVLAPSKKSIDVEERTSSLLSDVQGEEDSCNAQMTLDGGLSNEISVSRAWTVHVSLLPKASQPFPFEKDTAAYSV